MELENPEDMVFSSTENDTHFILTSNLKGYKVQSIGMQIMGERTQIADSGEKAVRLLAKVSVVVQAISGVKTFKKFFWIPDGVVLEKIKTEFNDKERVWSVLMPKLVSGVSGVRVEEVNRKEIGGGGHGRTGPVPDKVPGTEIPRMNEQKNVPQHEPEEANETSGVKITPPEEEPTHQLDKRALTSTQGTPAKEDADLEAKSRAAGECEQGPEAARSTKVEADQATQRVQFEECNAQAQPEQKYDQTEALKPDHPEEKVDDRKGLLAPPKKFRPCSLCLFAGSVILASIAVLVIHCSRQRKRR